MDAAAGIVEAGKRQQGLATLAQLVETGVPSSAVSRAVAAGRLTRVQRRVYAADPLDRLPRFVLSEEGVAPAYVAHVRAVLLSLGASAAACRRTAAALYGWDLLVEPTRTVEVAVAHGRSHVRRRGVLVVRRRGVSCCPVVALEETEPLSLTSPVDTVVDCALTLPELDAVVLCDSALRAGSVTPEELALAAAQLPGRRDAARVRRVLAGSDARSGSVLESALRWRLQQAGLVPQTQHVIASGGRHVLRADLAFPAARLVVEVDGAKWHLDRAKDRRTDNDLAVLGWRVLRYGRSDVLQEWRAVVADVRTALLNSGGQIGTHPAQLGDAAAA